SLREGRYTKGGICRDREGYRSAFLEVSIGLALQPFASYDARVFAAIATGFTAIFYRPFYNGLVFLMGLLPTHDVGVAVIIMTILVRFILFPLSRRAVQAQLAMKKIAPDVERLKQKYKDKPEEQGKAIFALYKERDIH